MDLEQRLAMAQVVNSLLKQEELLKFGNRKLDPLLATDLEDFTRKHLKNLLLCIMGEQTDSAFSNEEMVILKTFVTKIRTASTTAQGVI